MTRIWIAIAFACVVGGVGCKSKDGDNKDQKPVEVDKPVTCPPGSAVDNGACVPVVTAEKVAAVEAEKTRIEEAATLLDKVDSMTAPIELLDGIRQTDQWKKLAAANTKLQVVDKVVETLNEAVKQVRALKESLAGAATRLGNLKGELDKVMTETGAARQLQALRTQVSADLKAALEPVATDVASAIDKVLNPVTQQVSDATDLILGACAMAKLSGGGDKLKEMCAQAKDALPRAVAFLQDARTKPAALLGEVTRRLESELDQLVDDGTRAALDAAQTKVNALLKLPAGGAPAAGSGSGSAAAGSGSATK